MKQWFYNLAEILTTQLSKRIFFLRKLLNNRFTPQTIKYVSIFLFSLAIATVISVLVLFCYKIYMNRLLKFKPTIKMNDFVIQQKDQLTKWIEATEQRIKKSNLQIKVKRYFLLSSIFFIIAFAVSLKILHNLTASLLFSMIFFVMPEYVISLYEESLNKKIENQLISAIKLYTAESLQKKPMQKIFATISTKVPDPVGRYFADVHYDLISGYTTETALSKLSSKFQSYYGIMFVQLIHQSQKNATIIDLFPELMARLENHIELTRSNTTSLSGDRLQAFIISLLPIPAYILMARFFPETKIFIRDTYYGRLIITLSFLSIFVFVMLDRYIRRVD